jgi:hypothetical protein
LGNITADRQNTDLFLLSTALLAATAKIEPLVCIVHYLLVSSLLRGPVFFLGLEGSRGVLEGLVVVLVGVGPFGILILSLYLLLTASLASLDQLRLLVGDFLERCAGFGLVWLSSRRLQFCSLIGHSTLKMRELTANKHCPVWLGCN